MKVFSIEKYCEERGCAPSDFEQDDWRVKSNGKTKEEMYRMGYVTSESWMVEEPSMLVFSEELYKKYVGKDRPLTSDDWAYGLDGRSKEDIESNTHYEIEDEWCYKKTPVERFEREICERIVSDGTCVGVYCVNCPLFEGEWYCVGMDVVTLAETWLRLHPCEKKLVFSAEKFYADKSSLECLKALSRESGWPEDCNGKTEEECYLLGFEVHKNWMEER